MPRGASRPKSPPTRPSIRRLLVADALTTWVVPTGTLTVLALAVLLNVLDLLATPTASATAVLSLLVLAVFFAAQPLLERDHAARDVPRAVIFVAGLLSIVVLYYPFHCRLFPGSALARIAVEPGASGTVLPLTDHGTRFDLVVDAHLPLASDRRDRLVHYDLDLVDDHGEHAHYAGELGDRWRTRRLGRRGTAPARVEHLSTLHVVNDPTGGNLRIGHVDVSGESGATLAGAVYAHRGPGPGILYAGAALLILAALAVDRWRDPHDTPTIAIVTATCAFAAIVFSASSAGHPGLRDVIGAGVLGLIGLPVAALANRLARLVLKPSTPKARPRP